MDLNRATAAAAALAARLRAAIIRNQGVLLSSWVRWPVALLAPWLLVAVFGTGLTYWEHRTRSFSRWMGRTLLEGNAERATSGAIWEAILASREARTRIQAAGTPDTLLPGGLPQPPLHHAYRQERRSTDAVILYRHQRPAPLRQDRLTEAQMRDLAVSLRTYRAGSALLRHVELPSEPFLVHARIRAQLALQEGSLYPRLHQQLRQHDAAEAWNFVRMSTADSTYWASLLGPALTPADPDTATLHSREPAVAVALAGLLHHWSDSMHQDEMLRVRGYWEAGPDFQIHLVRNMNVFAGYAIADGERPVPFELPAELVVSLLELPVGDHAP